MKTKCKPSFDSHANGVPVAVVGPPKLLKLDFGCGPNPADGFEGVDALPFDGKVKHVLDVRGPWPWPDCSVEEARASHFLEHLTNLEGRWERVHFFNELYRVLVPAGKATLIFPHWCSNRYYGDPTHKEPFSEMGFYYLKREWRLGDPAKGLGANAPHTDVQYNPNGYSCDLDAVWGYSIHPAFQVKSQDTQQFAFAWYKEAIMDIICTITKPSK